MGNYQELLAKTKIDFPTIGNYQIPALKGKTRKILTLTTLQ
jgi:hypothetical protein